MQLETFLASFSAEIKGALAGGFVALLLEQGTVLHRITNGFGAVCVSYVFAPATVDLITHYFLKPTPNITIAIAAIWALVGIIIVEFVQRFARRLLFKSDSIADRTINKVLGKEDD